MVTKLGRRGDELSENFINEIKNMRKNQPELKNPITKMRNTLGGINSKLVVAKEQTSHR